MMCPLMGMEAVAKDIKYETVVLWLIKHFLTQVLLTACYQNDGAIQHNNYASVLTMRQDSISMSTVICCELELHLRSRQQTEDSFLGQICGRELEKMNGSPRLSEESENATPKISMPHKSNMRGT